MSWFVRAAIIVAAILVSRSGNAQEPAEAAAAVHESPTRGSLWATASSADHARAGCPQTMRPHAKPSRSPANVGYYVGGGVPLRGESRNEFVDGTWGLDYQGALVPRVVALGWSHGRRYQGGQGAYAPDGPKLHRSK